MRKTLLLAAVMGMLLGSVAVAQDSVLFFDIRDNVSSGQLINAPVRPYINPAPRPNLGKAGDAATLWVSPNFTNGLHLAPGWPNNDGDVNTSTGALWLYMDVNLAAGGGTGVISSIGLDMPVTPPATVRGTIGSLAFAWDTTPPIAWSGWANGTSSPTGVVGAKVVKVPVVAGTPSPVFDATGGLVPTARYKVGRLDVVGGPRNKVFGANHITNSTYKLKMTVNGLLITRVFNGVSPDPTENVAFGYALGVPEGAPLYVDGSVSGGTSTLEDATIVVAVKGDNSGNGLVQSGDFSGFTAALGLAAAVDQLSLYLNDFSGNTLVQSADFSGFAGALANGAGG